MIYTVDNPKLVKDIFNFKKINTFTGVVKDDFNNIVYYLNGNFHREDGPAVEWANGDKSWWLNGKLHRECGPAVIFVDGEKQWLLNGKCYGENNDFTIKSWKKFVKLQLLK